MNEQDFPERPIYYIALGIICVIIVCVGLYIGKGAHDVANEEQVRVENIEQSTADAQK